MNQTGECNATRMEMICIASLDDAPWSRTDKYVSSAFTNARG